MVIPEVPQAAWVSSHAPIFVSVSVSEPITMSDVAARRIVPPTAPPPVTNADVLMQAQMGMVAMTSSLMTALFGLQEDKA